MRISVYLPTRNRLRLLRRAVDSVLRQTHSDFELIVVDDASTDGTPVYLRDLARSDPRVCVHHVSSPRGAPHARNIAITHASGAWMTGLDDDDEFLPRRLEAVLAVAQALEAAEVRFSALYTQDEIVGTTGVHITRKPCCATLADLFRQNCVGNQIFVRRERIAAVGGYDENLPAWQDLDLAMRLVDRFGPARLIDTPLYRLHNDDRPDRISRKKKSEIVTAWRMVSQKWPSQPPALRQRLYLQVLSDHYGFACDLGDMSNYFSLGHGPASWLRWGRMLSRRLSRPGA